MSSGRNYLSNNLEKILLGCMMLLERLPLQVPIQYSEPEMNVSEQRQWLMTQLLPSLSQCLDFQVTIKFVC